MHDDVPLGVLLLYAMSKGEYTIRSYSTTARTFVPDPVMNGQPQFKPMAPLRDPPKFQVDKPLE